MTATFEIPAYAKSDAELWTPRLVQRAVVYGFIVNNRSQGRIGPASLKAFWVEYHDMEDSPKGSRGRRSYSVEDITRSEMVTLGFTDRHGGKHPAWMRFPELDSNPVALGIFERWVKWYVRGRQTRGEYQTEEQFAHSMSVSLPALKRNKTLCGRLIGERLNRASVLPWRVDTDKLK